MKRIDDQEDVVHGHIENSRIALVTSGKCTSKVENYPFSYDKCSSTYMFYFYPKSLGKMWKKDAMDKFGKPLLGPRGPKGQHSAPRGGPPRSWTNDELTKALENVWNKRMTTSQASRMYGIPYNSLLMYVRGKYGKSLKLDKLKKTTPAAHDSLNTIGNSRSTPKEKLLTKKTSSTITSDQEAEPQSDKRDGLSKPKDATDISAYTSGLDMYPFTPGSPLFSGLGRSHSTGDGNLMAGINSPGRIKDLIQDMQHHQAFLSHAERLKEIEKSMSTEQAKLIMPLLLERQAAEFAAMEADRLTGGEGFLQGPGSSGSVDGSSDGRPSSNEHAESVLYSLQKDSAMDGPPGSDLSEKERHIRQIIMQEASKRNLKEADGADSMEIAEDSNDDEIMSEQDPDDPAENFEREEDDEDIREHHDADKDDRDDGEEDNLEVVDSDDERKDESNREKQEQKPKDIDVEGTASEDKNKNEKKDYKSEVNVCINTKEVGQMPSKITVKSSAEISAK